MKTNATIYKISILLAATVFAVACERSKSEDLMPKPTKKVEGNITAGNIQFEFKPKVDVLFVIDNSFSMKSEQTRLQQAADKFVESFGENSSLDYRIGVITPYDSERCEKTITETSELTGKYVTEEAKCYPMGRLQPLKSADPKSAPFITRSADAKDLLREALTVGTLHRLRADSGAEFNGPRYEEFFSPILRALDPSQNKINGSFLREDARLVIVIVTDEGDSTLNVSTDSFLFQLEALAGKDNFDLNAVVYSKISATCKPEKYAASPDSIIEVVRASKGHVYSICDTSFGNHLADIGADIRKNLVKKEIVLQDLIEKNTLTLKYGETVIPRGQGWSYDPSTNTVSITPDLKIVYDPKASFALDFVLIDPRGLKNGRAKPAQKPAPAK